MRRATLQPSLPAVVRDDCPDGTTSLPCPDCQADLEVHQPATGQPDRLLATCDHCGAWFTVDCLPEEQRCALVRLPDTAAVWASLGA